jgi:hypothetical protein
MVTFQTDILIQDLRNVTLWAIETAERDFLFLTPAQRRQRPANGGWSVGECLQHLNFYGDFYLPEMRRAMQKSNLPPTPQYQSGWLGKKFIESIKMKPDGSISKMKSPKKANPIHIEVADNIVEQFIAQQRDYLQLLDEAQNAHFAKVRVGISIATWLKVSLGDALQFTIYHNQRHLHQALRVFKEL